MSTDRSVEHLHLAVAHIGLTIAHIVKVLDYHPELRDGLAMKSLRESFEHMRMALDIDSGGEFVPPPEPPFHTTT